MKSCLNPISISVITPFIITYETNVWMIIFQWREEEDHTVPLALISTTLTLVFVVEVIMKTIAFTPRGYWQSRRNRYDLFVTVLGVIWVCIYFTLHVGIFYLCVYVLFFVTPF